MLECEAGWMHGRLAPFLALLRSGFCCFTTHTNNQAQQAQLRLQGKQRSGVLWAAWEMCSVRKAATQCRQRWQE